jgi:hypothetical protein
MNLALFSAKSTAPDIPYIAYRTKLSPQLQKEEGDLLSTYVLTLALLLVYREGQQDRVRKGYVCFPTMWLGLVKTSAVLSITLK